jgi:hypothetical protein
MNFAIRTALALFLTLGKPMPESRVSRNSYIKGKTTQTTMQTISTIIIVVNTEAIVETFTNSIQTNKWGACCDVWCLISQ